LLLLFDILGRRYGKLPSELLQTADSFDLMVFDVAQTYEEYLNKKNSKNGSVGDMVDQKDLEEYYKRVKGENPRRHRKS